jgi:hypothetical protein
MAVRTSWISAAAVAVLSLAAAGNAHAQPCEAPAPGLEYTVPSSGGTFPANGAILLVGSGLQFGKIAVKVDGKPATLQVDSELSWTGPSELRAVRVVPAPTVGQLITLKGSFCTDDGTGAACPDEALEFLAGPADAAPPTLSPDAELNVLFFEDAPVRTAPCGSESNYHAFVGVGPLDDGGSAGWARFQVDVIPSNSRTHNPLRTVYALASATAQEISTGFLSDQLQGLPPETAFCFRITAMDSAANAADDTLEICAPCHAATIDAAGAATYEEMGPVDWESEPVYEAGPCGEPPVAEIDEDASTGEDVSGEDGGSTVGDGTAGGDASGGEGDADSDASGGGGEGGDTSGGEGGEGAGDTAGGGEGGEGGEGGGASEPKDDGGCANTPGAPTPGAAALCLLLAALALRRTARA